MTILSPRLAGNNFSFDFATKPYQSYTVQWATNVTTPTWVNHTNLMGNGSTTNVLVLLLNSSSQYFRVRALIGGPEAGTLNSPHHRA